LTDIARLTDDELWERTRRLAQAARGALCDLIEHLAEIDRRNLSVKRGRGSLFEYCMYSLGFSEGAAYRRIRAARAIRTHPPIRTLLREGRLTLETVALIHPFLEEKDAASLVERACGRSMRQVQSLIAGRNQSVPGRDIIREWGPVKEPPPPVAEAPLLEFATTAAPNPEPPSAVVSPTPPAEPRNTSTPIAPSASKSTPPRHFRFAFTADAEFHQMLLRARSLLRHKYPNGRLEGVLKDALVALLKRKDRSFRWRR
jgi:hypothetical protein